MARDAQTILGADELLCHHARDEFSKHVGQADTSDCGYSDWYAASLAIAIGALSDMGVALGIFGMMFCIETFVVRHYGVAVIFITPLTIFLAEYSAVQPTAISEIIVTRFWDTVLGCLMGVLGGIVILSPIVRQKLQVIVDKVVAKLPI